MHPPPGRNHIGVPVRCELLSDFVYSFFEHNADGGLLLVLDVVNCFQILYIRSLNTIGAGVRQGLSGCELLSDFVYSFFEHNWPGRGHVIVSVVNCFQILYIRSLNTMSSDYPSRTQRL